MEALTSKSREQWTSRGESLPEGIGCLGEVSESPQRLQREDQVAATDFQRAVSVGC